MARCPNIWPAARRWLTPSHVDGGPEVVWLGAAIVLGAGSTSFEMLRYVGDRFLLLPMPEWSANPIDPISVRDVLYYLVAAADADRVPPALTTSAARKPPPTAICCAPTRASPGIWRAPVPVYGIDTALVSKLTGVVLPVPGGLAADLVESLDFPMMASDDGLAGLVPEPPGGLVDVETAIRRR